MTTKQLLLPALILTCLGSTAEEKQIPIACNLKAFTPQERIEWRKLIDEVGAAQVPSGELMDGYTFRINPQRASLTKVAQWIDLERKCCPFFDFQVGLHGADGALLLTLTGAKGVKQFIREDFSPWFQPR